MTKGQPHLTRSWCHGPTKSWGGCTGKGCRTLDDLPVATLIDLARHLDMHPADLVASLDAVLDNPRADTTDTGPPGAAEDALTVLTALAAAVSL